MVKSLLSLIALVLTLAAAPMASGSEAMGQRQLAYAGNWHVVEDLSTATCYRVHGMGPRDGWRDFGAFNTFRMAGAWIWRHRDVCRSSPVFG